MQFFFAFDEGKLGKNKDRLSLIQKHSSITIIFSSEYRLLHVAQPIISQIFESI